MFIAPKDAGVCAIFLQELIVCFLSSIRLGFQEIDADPIGRADNEETVADIMMVMRPRAQARVRAISCHSPL